jgi:stalled ribosome alternative rescue factor ArfA
MMRAITHPLTGEPLMSTCKKRRSAKSLVFDPLFRTRQEKAKKGKGSYARKPRTPQQDPGLSFSTAA